MHSHIMVRNVVERAFRMGITPADTILMYLPLSPAKRTIEAASKNDGRGKPRAGSRAATFIMVC